MSECTEVYVYEIEPDKIEEFLTVKDQLISEARSLPRPHRVGNVPLR